MGTRSPSNHLSLVRLETIAQNNYTNEASTKDYDPDEVNALIWGKQAAAQERVQKTRAAKLEADMLALSELPPPIPAEACEGYPTDPIIPHGEVRKTPHTLNFAGFRIISARYDGRCRETGLKIWAGDEILWHKDHKTIYCAESDMFYEYKQNFNMAAPF